MSIQVSARVVEREARVFSKLWRASVFSSFVTPVLYLGAMGVGLGGIVDAHNRSIDGLSYLVFVTPGLMAAGAVMSSSGESLWPILSGFKWMRHYEAMSAAVPRPADIYNGVVAWLGCHVAMSATAFLVVATLLGSVHMPYGTATCPTERRMCSESSRVLAVRQMRLPCRSNCITATRSTASRRRCSPTR